MSPRPKYARVGQDLGTSVESRRRIYRLISSTADLTYYILFGPYKADPPRREGVDSSTWLCRHRMIRQGPV